MVFFWWARTLLFQQKRIFTKPRENQKTKKPKLFGEVLVSGQKMFFLVFLEFFLFFLFRFLNTKENLVFLWRFLKEVLLEVRQKTKKTQGFFVFLVRCLEYMYEQAMKKQKKP